MGGTDMGFIGLLRTLEQITRPPRLGHDVDSPLTVLSWAAELFPQYTSASNHAGTGAESAPSPTIVQSAPPPTVDGGAGGGGVLHSPGARLPHPDDAAAEWIGWAVPPICTVLHEHRPFQRRPIASNDDGRVYCSDEDGNIHRRFDDYQAWLEHIGPILATALMPQEK